MDFECSPSPISCGRLDVTDFFSSMNDTGIQRGSETDRNIRRAILLAMRVLGLKSVDERYSMDLISEVCFALNLINNQN